MVGRAGSPSSRRSRRPGPLRGLPPVAGAELRRRRGCSSFHCSLFAPSRPRQPLCGALLLAGPPPGAPRCESRPAAAGRGGGCFPRPRQRCSSGGLWFRGQSRSKRLRFRRPPAAPQRETTPAVRLPCPALPGTSYPIGMKLGPLLLVRFL